MAALTAYSATVPAPRITTSVGVIPVTPPSITPLPPRILLRYSAAISMLVVPAMALILLTAGKHLCSSWIFSNAIADTFFCINPRMYFSLQWVKTWKEESRVCRSFIHPISSGVGGLIFRSTSLVLKASCLLSVINPPRSE